MLGGDGDGAVTVQVEELGDLGPRALHVGGGKVDLVDDGDDLQSAVRRQVEVGEGLGLDPLGRVHDQHRALAGGQRARDLVGEVHVPRRIDEVERVLLAVSRGVQEADGMRLDRDAALFLQVHRVEHLAHRFLGVHGAGEGEQSVGQRGLAVVDVRDNGEVSDLLDGHRTQDNTPSGPPGPGGDHGPGLDHRARADLGRRRPRAPLRR